MNAIFNSTYRALIIGASGAIGGAFVEILKEDLRCEYLHSLSRSSCPGFDLMDEDSIAKVAEVAKINGPYHLIVDATGVLSIDGIGPEKSISQLTQETLIKSFSVNAVGPVLVMKHFSSLLADGPAIYAKLSAKVGSISDNKLGGWYSYRASKAALNMFLQTSAIELQRRNPLLRIVALQPGTVDSKLSKPFQANVRQLLKPRESVAGMLEVMNELPTKSGAYFIDYRGNEIDW